MHTGKLLIALTIIAGCGPQTHSLSTDQSESGQAQMHGGGITAVVTGDGVLARAHGRHLTARGLRVSYHHGFCRV